MSSSYFVDFQHEELMLLLALPYRIGVWMSHIDDVPGSDRDEQQEEMALTHVLNRLYDRAEKTGFVAGILREVILHKAEWGPWGMSYDTALDDIGRALKLADSRLPTGDASEYRKCLFYVAKTVAMAASEQGGEPSGGLSKMPGGMILGRFADWLAAKSGKQIPANISPKEQGALKQLLHRLKDR